MAKKKNALTAARSSMELTSGLGRAMAVPRRAMAIVVREKRILAEAFVGLYLNGWDWMCLLMCLDAESVRKFNGIFHPFYTLRRTPAVALASDPSVAFSSDRNLNTPHAIVDSALASHRHPHVVLNYQPRPSHSESLFGVS